MNDIQPNMEAPLPEHDILGFNDQSVLYLGETFSGRELWLNRSDLSRHMLVTGTTGSGKTELLLGMAANSILAGNGLIFLDGKGDMANYAKIYALAAKVGRADDVQLLNFTSPPQRGRAAGSRVSNTMNPFDGLDADAIVQIVVSLMSEASDRDGMWRDRAIGLITAVIIVAAWQRDNQGIPVTFGRLRGMMELNEIIQVATFPTYSSIPAEVRDAMRGYLKALPGYLEDKALKQNQTAIDQHGYLTMQFTKIFSTMHDTYGHIFDVSDGDVGMKDVIANRRILVVLLPSLAKSSSEISGLGRIVVTLVKNVMSRTLIANPEGTWDQVVDQRNTSPENPFLIILDEASYYVTDGMSAMAGQARSLGFALVFATQDVNVLERANSAEFNGIMANTGIKIFMTLQNPADYRVNQYLPSVDRYENPRDQMVSLMQAKMGIFDLDINDVQRRLHELNPGREDSRYTQSNYDEESIALQQRLEEMRRQIRTMHRSLLKYTEDNPNWTLTPTLKALKPGEFVVIKSGKFQRGRALYVSGSLGRPDVRLPAGIDPSVDKAAVEVYYNETPEVLSTLDPIEIFDTLDFAVEMGSKTLRCGDILKGVADDDADEFVQRGFALAFGFKNIASGEWAQEVSL